MPRPRKHGRSQRYTLWTVWYPLVNGMSIPGDVEFENDAEERAAWFQFRDQIMAEWPNFAGTSGVRPLCWWKYSSPEPSNAHETSVEQLRRLGELTPREEEILLGWEAHKKVAAAERTAAIMDAHRILSGPVVLVAGIVATADHLGIRPSMVDEAAGAHDVALLCDVLDSDGAARFAPGSRLRRNRAALFADPDIEAIVARSRRILELNADVHADLVDRLLLHGELSGAALAEALNDIQVDPEHAAECDVRNRERVEQMRAKNAELMGKKRKRPGGGELPKFTGGHVDRAKMLAKLGLGEDHFGERGLRRVERIVSEHKNYSEGSDESHNLRLR
jgi:hypothetical protein